MCHYQSNSRKREYESLRNENTHKWEHDAAGGDVDNASDGIKDDRIVIENSVLNSQ
jgi:hypothetical protein